MGHAEVNAARLQCVNGDWRNSLGETSLKGLACESCVQVGATGYAGFDQRNEQDPQRVLQGAQENVQIGQFFFGSQN
jgi:hypothetical protein